MHGIESDAGVQFRWTSLVAGIRLALEPGVYQLCLRLHQVRPLVPDQEVSIFFNHTEVDVQYDAVTTSLHWMISPSLFISGEEQWILVLCLPWRIETLNSMENRTLGLPVSALEIEAISAVEGEKG